MKDVIKMETIKLGKSGIYRLRKLRKIIGSCISDEAIISVALENELNSLRNWRHQKRLKSIEKYFCKKCGKKICATDYWELGKAKRMKKEELNKIYCDCP